MEENYWKCCFGFEKEEEEMRKNESQGGSVWNEKKRKFHLIPHSMLSLYLWCVCHFANG
jgi:hypothetical protein